MSSTSTSQVSSKQRSAFGHLWWVGLLTVVASVVVNTVIVLVARTLFPVAPTFTPLELRSVILFTVIGAIGAVIVFALMMRWSKHPARLFQRVAWILLLISLIPDLLLPFVQLFPGTTIPGVVALILMHVATGLICIGTLPRAGY